MVLFSELRKYLLKALGISKIWSDLSVVIDNQHKLQKQNETLRKQYEMLLKSQNYQKECLQEILKANLFRDAICDCEWLKFKSFSPGGWAADYGVLFTLCKILSHVKPKNILEFGLGQSSRILHQFGSYYASNVVTVEHNEEWIDFFKAEIGNSYPVNICLLELEERLYNGQKTLSYKGLGDVTKGKRYDLVVVDGPYGAEHYSRSQLIDLVREEKLSDSFCVIMDDYNRTGEQETMQEVMNILSMRNISFKSKKYQASKQHFLICSEDLHYLTTLSGF